MFKLLNISQASKFLNVTPDCLRKWHKSGKLVPFTTAGGHRRYNEDDLKKFIGIPVDDVPDTVSVATYARVSSNNQKQTGDLDRQSLRLSEYCAKNNLDIKYIIKDTGSGLNDCRTGFSRLTELVIKHKINTIVIEHKDRLTRFQFNFIKKMFESYGCKLIVLNDDSDVSDDEELVSDMMSLLASFSGKFYGRRSLDRMKNKNN